MGFEFRNLPFEALDDFARAEQYRLLDFELFARNQPQTLKRPFKHRPDVLFDILPKLRWYGGPRRCGQLIQNSCQHGA